MPRRWPASAPTSPTCASDQELVDCTDYFADTPFRVFQADYVGAVVMPGGASSPPQFDAWQEWAKQRGARGLAYVTVGEDGELGGPVAKNLSDAERAGLAAHVGASPATASSSPRGRPSRRGRCSAPPAWRSAKRCGLIDENAWASSGSSTRRCSSRPRSDAVAAGDVAVGSGAWTAVHHAFTSPKAEFLDTFDTDPGLGARLRLRHGVQRQRDRRRLDPYPPPRRPGARLRGHGPVRGGGPGEVRLPARRLQVRRAAARRHRLRLGPDRALLGGPSRSAMSSPSPSPAAASTRSPRPRPRSPRAAQGGRRRRQAHPKPRRSAGKSPMQIALGRLLRDKIAVALRDASCCSSSWSRSSPRVIAKVIRRVPGVAVFRQRRARPSHRHAQEGTAATTASTPITRSECRAANGRGQFGPLALRLPDLAWSSPAAPPSSRSLVGVIVGLIAGFAGGKVDKVTLVRHRPLPHHPVPAWPRSPWRRSSASGFRAVTRITSTIQRFTLICVLSIFGWMGTARHDPRRGAQPCASASSSRPPGCSACRPSRILIKELLPNLAAPIVIIASSLMLPTFVAAGGRTWRSWASA
jgi:hypothetical protein